MANFKDLEGNVWVLDLKERHLRLVKNMLKDGKGRPLDVLAMAENGTLYELCNSLERMIDVVFLCCLDQIKERFDLATYDRTNESLYVLLPEQRNEPPFAKSQRWFAGLIDGKTLVEMTQAFQEAIVNFIQNPAMQEAVRDVFQRKENLLTKTAENLREVWAHREKLGLEEIESKAAEEKSKTLSDLRKAGETSNATPGSSE